MLCPAFLNLFAVYPFKYKLFIKILSSSPNTMLIVDNHCSDVCCDEFLVPQIGRRSKQVKEHGQLYLQSVWGKTRYFKHQKYKKNCGWITKLEPIVCVFFHICRKFVISQGSVATCLKRDTVYMWCGIGPQAYREFLAMSKLCIW